MVGGLSTKLSLPGPLRHPLAVFPTLLLRISHIVASETTHEDSQVSDMDEVRGTHKGHVPVWSPRPLQESPIQTTRMMTFSAPTASTDALRETPVYVGLNRSLIEGLSTEVVDGA
jgi:hypothetical protein